MKNKQDKHGFATRAIHAGQSPEPTTGAVMTADLCHLHIQTEFSGCTHRLRVRALAEPDAPRLRALHRRPGGRRSGFCVRFGTCRQRHGAGIAGCRQPHGRSRRHVRRQLAPVRACAQALDGARGELFRPQRDRLFGKSIAAGHENDLGRNAFQPVAQGHRPLASREDRQGAQAFSPSWTTPSLRRSCSGRSISASTSWFIR